MPRNDRFLSILANPTEYEWVCTYGAIYIIGGYYFLQKDSTYGASLFVKSNTITQVEFILKEIASLFAMKNF
ncbi:MAG TPA: hypothetical protein VLZ75_01855 [Chitinophagales bacterium]|nr:hypothetical protein [Chitinophagales bacterium]